jgi:hypothetical protein
LTQIGVEELKLSKYQRDVYVISEVYKVAQLVNLYDAKKDDFGEADPRRFYFTVLQSLKLAQPRTQRTPLTKTPLDCSLEAGLYFEEEMNQRQLANYGADSRLVELIFDIERLRTFHLLSWNLYRIGVADARATTWVGDEPRAPDNLTPMIENSSAAIQNMYKAIIPYVDTNYRSSKEFEVAFMQKMNQDAARDFPVRK